MPRKEKEFTITEIGTPCMSELDFKLFCKFLYDNYKDDMYRCLEELEKEKAEQENAT